PLARSGRSAAGVRRRRRAGCSTTRDLRRRGTPFSTSRLNWWTCSAYYLPKADSRQSTPPAAVNFGNRDHRHDQTHQNRTEARKERRRQTIRHDRLLDICAGAGRDHAGRYAAEHGSTRAEVPRLTTRCVLVRCPTKVPRTARAPTQKHAIPPNCGPRSRAARTTGQLAGWLQWHRKLRNG